MKKIINGKKYDTATAKEVGSFENGGTWRDFSHFCETLYRKRTGEYFLHGEGGPMTRYSKRVDSNNWSGGEEIAPMSYEVARDWAEEHFPADLFESEFGTVSEGDAAVLSVSVSAALSDKARKAAAAAGTSLSAYISSLIENA